MKRKLRWAMLIFLLLLGPTCQLHNSVQGQGESDSAAPYLYYFSDDLNAWVIERADGSDRWLLGEGLVPAPSNERGIIVDGSGWSPSGNWFAWSASLFTPGIGDFRGYVISADGTRQVGLLSDMKDVRMAWSPVEDLLLAAGYYGAQSAFPGGGNVPSYEGEMVFKMRLIDPTQSAQLAKFERRIAVDWWGNRPPDPPTVRWVLDGQYAVVETHGNGGEAFLDAPDASEFFIMGVDGMVTTKQINHVLYADEFQNLRLTQDSMPVSALGNILYWDGSEYRLENLITGGSHSLGNLISYDAFEQPFGPFARPQVLWSPDGQFGLVVGESAFFITVEGDSVHVEAAPNDILLEDDLFNYHDYLPPSLWSPNGNHLLFQTAGGVLHHYDISERRLTILMEGISDDGTFWQWLDENRVLVAKNYDVDYTEQQFYLYDLRDAANPLETFVVEDTAGYRFAVLSPDGDSFAYMLDGPVIYDRESEQSSYVRPDADSYFSIGGGETRWSEDSQWLLIFDNALVAGGGGMQHLGVVRADGQFRRDLSYTPFPSPIVLDWLPPQVDSLPDPLPPADDPAPVQHLSGEDWIFALSWSPDGQQVAGSSLGGKLRTWDLVTGESLLQTGAGRIEAGNGRVIAWEQMGDTYQALIAPDPQLQTPEYTYPLAFSPDGQVVVQHNANRDYAAFDVQTGEELALLAPNYSYANAVSFSPNGHYLAVGYPFHPSTIWDTTTWEIILTLPHPSLAVAFSPDSQYLAVGVSWDVEIWRVSDLIQPTATE